ncbi:MAG: sporulation sigma factor SigE, partial [Oscillospiraceae bacterium]|nr:sporulation sigma factor SigE [Oscillospiraceae bacterium]
MRIGLKQKIVSFLSVLNGVLYINGPQVLPPPLTARQEAEVFAGIENKDEEAINKLIVHNLRLVVYIARKFEVVGANIEDLISIGTIGLIKAVN